MNFRYAGVEFNHVSEGDAADLHEYFRNIFGSYGLRGQALDEAIATSAGVAFAALEKHRAGCVQIALVKA